MSTGAFPAQSTPRAAWARPGPAHAMQAGGAWQGGKPRTRGQGAEPRSMAQARARPAGRRRGGPSVSLRPRGPRKLLSPPSRPLFRYDGLGEERGAAALF